MALAQVRVGIPGSPIPKRRQLGCGAFDCASRIWRCYLGTDVEEGPDRSVQT